MNRNEAICVFILFIIFMVAAIATVIFGLHGAYYTNKITESTRICAKVAGVFGVVSFFWARSFHKRMQKRESKV